VIELQETSAQSHKPFILIGHEKSHPKVAFELLYFLKITCRDKRRQNRSDEQPSLG